MNHNITMCVFNFENQQLKIKTSKKREQEDQKEKQNGNKRNIQQQVKNIRFFV